MRQRGHDLAGHEDLGALPRFIIVAAEGVELVHHDLFGANVDHRDLGPLHQRARLLDAADDLERRPLLHRRRKPVARVGGDIAPERDHERLQPPLVGGALVGRLGRGVGIAEIVERNGGGLGGDGPAIQPGAREEQGKTATTGYGASRTSHDGKAAS